MKLVVVVGFLALAGAGCLAQHAEPADLDPLDGLDEQEFEEYFHLDKVTDEAELARREAALSAHEAEIKEVNQEYEAGEVSWFDGVNEFADLPDDEFLSQKTEELVVRQVGKLVDAVEPAHLPRLVLLVDLLDLGLVGGQGGLTPRQLGLVGDLVQVEVLLELLLVQPVQRVQVGGLGVLGQASGAGQGKKANNNNKLH